jgi:hypothetical protein
MNVTHNYDLQMFNIMGREPQQMTKSGLSCVLMYWLSFNGYKDGFLIHLNPTISMLSGLEDTGTYSIEGDGWWDFVTMVYKRWKR